MFGVLVKLLLLFFPYCAIMDFIKHKAPLQSALKYSNSKGVELV